MYSPYISGILVCPFAVERLRLSGEVEYVRAVRLVCERREQRYIYGDEKGALRVVNVEAL
jgi:hypothetical protein